MFTPDNKVNYKRVALVYLILLIPVAGLGAFWDAQKKAGELNIELLKLEQKLQSTLQHYQSLPQVLQKSEVILQALRAPTTASIDAANRQLQETNEILQADVIYLLDSSGLTVASSNYHELDSFVGENFSFRPYFNRSNAGLASSYFALGAKSGERGYYFASPVSDGQRAIGVMVVKVSLAFIEELWREPQMDFVISDADGVIFFSSRATWQYKTMFKLSRQRRDEVRQSLRYGAAQLASISQYTSLAPLFEPRVTLRDGGHDENWIIQSAEMPEWGWHMFALAPRTTIWPATAAVVALYTLLALLLFVVYLYLGKRRELQLHLKEMNTRLETRVDDLTAELRQSNVELQQSVDHYKRTQTELQDTQTQLIQTAKIAVLGEFSAGLHHELAQPLQALQSYSSNCQKMLSLGKTGELQPTLGEINSICNTMASIVAKFKIFARRTKPNPRPTSAHEIIAATWSIVRTKFEECNVEFENDCIDVDIFCEPVLVEQVLVNLLSNALQAVAHTENPHVRLTSIVEGDYLNLCVADNGPGVSNEQMAQLFHPFYTTKETGLGLGLTLSRRIIESQNGVIDVTAADEGGLAFNIKLPLYRMKEANEPNLVG